MTLPFGIDISAYQYSQDGSRKPDLMTIIRQAWCLRATIEHFVEYNGSKFEKLEQLYEPPYIAR